MRRCSVLSSPALLTLCLLAACGAPDPAQSVPVDVGEEGADGADGSDGSDGADGADSGEPDCGEWLQPDGAGGCEDIDECEADNGGCGDPALWECQNQLGAAPTCVFDWTDDVAALTAGVSTVVHGGSLSSRLVVWGDTAFPLFANDADQVFAAGARVGAGKALHLGHEGQLSGALTGEGDGAVVLRNALAWMLPEGGVVGVSSGMTAAVTFIEAEGYAVVTAGPDDLGTVDLWVTTTYDDHSADQDAAIGDWLEAGGAVIAGGHAWWWAYSTGGDDPFHDHPGNQWLGAAGLTLSGDTAEAASVSVAGSPDPLLHAGRALTAAAAHVSGETLPDADAWLAADAAGFAASVLPVDSPWFEDARAVLAATDPVVPSAEDPVEPATEPIDALVVRIDHALAERLPVDELVAHPAAADFPGAVPEDALRTDASVELEAAYGGRDSRYLYSGAGGDRMVSTGLYVPPGERVLVTAPAAWVGAGLWLQVGAHTDTLWGKDSWERSPDVVRRFDLDAESMEIASAFGGLLFVRVPAGIDAGLGTLQVEGAVEAPRFVAGTHSDGDWTGGLRDAPAPWAELEADGLVLTVPSAEIRDLDDPTALMAFWDDVMDAQASLAAISPDRVRAERIVTDRQISAGWMHSGYPIMAHNASAADLTSLDNLSANGDWGAFHELGHNHQWRDWLLPGTTETSCNLWSVYTMEEVVGIDRSAGHSALSATSRADRISAYVSGGRNFSADWSVWTALETWLQIQEAFGWEPLIAAQAAYLADAPGDDPGTDQGRIDRWVTRMSDATGRDLTPFTDAWGVPLSASVRADVAHLPAWTDHPMP